MISGFGAAAISGFGATIGSTSVVAAPDYNGLLDSLVAYWPGNEASGNLLDAHIYKKDASPTNAPTYADGLVYTTARQHVKTSNQYFSRSDDDDIAARVGDFTIATWVRYDTISQQTLWDDAPGGVVSARLITSTFTANKLDWLVYDSTGAYKALPCTNYGNLPTGTWLAVVASYKASNRQISLSINGGTPDTDTLASDIRIAGTGWVNVLGYSGSRGFDGRMGPTAFWSRLLSADDIAAWYNGGAGLPYSRLDYSTKPIVDVFVVAGQSNASGRGTNNQTWTHASLVPLMLGNDYRWSVLADPTDTNVGQIDTVSADAPTSTGSPWPLLATQIMAKTGRPCAFVPCAKGSSSIVSWLPGADHSDRTTLYGSMNYRTSHVLDYTAASMRLRGVLWHQGETDALASMNAATYNGHLDTIANAIMTDQGIPLIPCKLQNSSGIGDAAELEINTAIGTAWADNANVVAGPDLTDIGSDDDYHLKTDGNLSTAATRWYNAIVAAGLI